MSESDNSTQHKETQEEESTKNTVAFGSTYSELSSHENIDEEPQKSAKKSSLWKKILKWTLGTILTIVLLLVLFTALLYLPKVQSWVIGSVATRLAKTAQVTLQYDDIRVGFPLKLKLVNVHAKDLNTNKELGQIGLLTANVNPFALLRGASVPISKVQLEKSRLDLSLSNDSIHIQANIGKFTVNQLQMDINTLSMEVGDVLLHDADVAIKILTDTIPQPKEEPSKMIVTLQSADLKNISADIWLYPDTMEISSRIIQGNIGEGEVNLFEQYYQAKRVDIVAEVTALGEEMLMLPMPWSASLSGTNVRYGGVEDLSGNIQSIYYQVGDTVLIQDGHFRVQKDKSRFVVIDMDLQTMQSHLYGFANMPFNGWKPDSIGLVNLDLRGKITPHELRRFLNFAEGLPTEPYDTHIIAKGDLENLVTYSLSLEHDETAKVKVTGKAQQALNSNRKVDAFIQASTGDKLMSTLTRFINKGKAKAKPSWVIPGDLSLQGDTHYSSDMMRVNLQLSDNVQMGELELNAIYHPKRKQYSADLHAKELSLGTFLQTDSLGKLSATLNVQGKGNDFYHKNTQASLFLDIDSIEYKKHQLKDILLVSELKDNQVFFALNSQNEALKLTAQSDMLLAKKRLEGSINILIDTIVPEQLGFDLPALKSGKLELRSSIRSDLDEYYDFKGEVENFVLETDKATLYPRNTYISAQTSNSSMYGEIASGDLALTFKAANGLKDFTHRVNRVIEESSKSLSDSLGQVNMAPWIEHYPNMEINFKMGRDNLLRTYFDEHRIGATSVLLDLKTKEGEGLEGMGVVTTFQTDTFRVDNIDLVLRQDSSFFTAVATVHKEHFRNQPAFDIMLSLSSNVMRSEAYIDWTDAQHERFLQTGLELYNRPNGDITFGFTPDPIVLAYNTFHVINDDYITLPFENRSHIQADMALTSESGAKITIKDIPSDTGHLVRANIKDLQLSLLDRIPMIPNLEGIVNATADWTQKADNASEVSTHLSIKDLLYNKKEIGSIKTDASIHDDKNGVLIYANLHLNNEEVAIADAYSPKGKDKTLYRVLIHDFPLRKVNPFLPNKYAQLHSGVLNSNLSNFTTNGSITEASPSHLNGWIRVQDAKAFSPLANETYLIDDKKIEVINDEIHLNNFALIVNDSRLLINGGVVLSPKILMDLNISGNDVLLLNSNETNDTMLFGRVNTDANLKVKGPLNAFNLSGHLALKGDTDVTYHSQTEEIERHNGYKDLVEFTDFTDTLFVRKKNAVDSLSLGGNNIRLALHIDPAAQITAILSKSGSNMVRVQGGGDFNLSMPPYGSITLNGAYNIQKGDAQMAFTYLTRRFTIQKGSNITWNGILMEPDINIKATSNMKSNVSLPGEPNKQVDFVVSVIAENSLDNLKLRFETDAPQDLAMKNRLAELSQEEQNKQSIMLLATGLYFGGGGGINNAKGFDVNSALSSFLASQINSLAGEALDAEINFGISDGTNAYGQGTNYSYSITKRLFNNRISVKVGGKMVTGAAAMGLQQTFIDNMSLDYQLDQAGTHYLRLFHNKNYENLLDGEVIETGVGYVIRRKLNELSELFKFSKSLTSNEAVPPAMWRFYPRKTKVSDNKTEDDNATKE